MEAIGTFLKLQPFIVLFLVIGLGYAVSKIKVGRFSLGIGTVLFVGITLLEIGICGGLLYILHGNWTYTSMIKKRIQVAIIPHDHLQLLHLYLLAAILVGIIVSALLQKSVNLRVKPTKRCLLKQMSASGVEAA